MTKPAKLFSGGGGLVSTAPDYLRFCQMLLNGGEFDDVRVLSAQAVKQMTTNALPSDIRIYGGDEVGARAGTTFGLGFAIRTNPVYSWIPGVPGSFSWPLACACALAPTRFIAKASPEMAPVSGALAFGSAVGFVKLSTARSALKNSA